MNITGGRKANDNGALVENIVCQVLDSKGFQYKRHVKLYKGIYENDIKVDVEVTSPAHFVIECKWQSSKGSVDEKFPYLVENIKKCCPIPGVVIVDGSAARESAVRWMKNQVDSKLIGVFSIVEFMNWIEEKRWS